MTTIRLAILLSLCTVPAGLHVMAPDCSSWTRISRGTSMRDALCTLGRVDLQWVRNGSLMIARLLAHDIVGILVDKDVLHIHAGIVK